MNKTIFCHRPINNQPCGECNPCEQAMNDGMKYRFSYSALYRYRITMIKKRVRSLLEETKLAPKTEKVDG
jgi:hypothetical protein